MKFCSTPMDSLFLIPYQHPLFELPNRQYYVKIFPVVQELKGGREESRDAGILDENTSKENSEVLLLHWLCEKELERQSGGDS